MFSHLFRRATRRISDRTHQTLANAVQPVFEGMESRMLFSFSTPLAAAAGINPASMRTADFNNDGKNDVAAINGVTGTVNVLLGNGDGSFQASPVVSSAGGTGSKMVVGDFDKDGNLDIVTDQGYSLSMEYGNGDGSFRAGGTYYVGAYA